MSVCLCVSCQDVGTCQYVCVLVVRMLVRVSMSVC